MDLSIIIVNWNSVAFLRKCLGTVYANGAGLEFEVVVIDNGSMDGCAEVMAREFPQAVFIQSVDNLGFAGANNVGFQHCEGRNILFLNPDTEIIGPGLRDMSAFLDSTPNAGAVGAMLLNSDGSIQTSCIQAFPSLLGEVLDSEYLRRKFPQARLWGMRQLFEPGNTTAVVDAVSGACLMIKRTVFEAVNGFSTEYFMYMEDIDLCYRATRSGFKTYYLSAAKVIHHGGRSSDAKPEDGFATIMMRESRYTYMRLRKGRGWAAAYSCAIGLSAALRVCLLGGVRVVTVGKLRPEKLRGAFLKWGKVLRWACGLETWANRASYGS
jgi:GT2 family glycosyltransferase